MVDIESKSVLKRLKEAVITNPSKELKVIVGGTLVFISVVLVAAGINELIKDKGNGEENTPNFSELTIDPEILFGEAKTVAKPYSHKDSIDHPLEYLGNDYYRGSEDSENY
jgi:hypothetical protein